MRQPLDYIFIDTSVFQSSSFFKKTSNLHRIFDLAEQGWVSILMPEITKREWLKHFKSSTNLKFEDITRKVALMGNTEKTKTFSEQYESFVEQYDDVCLDAFNYHFNRAKVVVLDFSYAQTKVEDVFEKYFSQEKPFGSNGKNKEFPDAFALASLEQYAADKGISQILIFSADKDMELYKSDLFRSENLDDYLSSLVTERIPKFQEEAKQKKDMIDIARLVSYWETTPNLFRNDVYETVEYYLYDETIYSERFNFADIESLYIKKLDLVYKTDSFEVLSVDELSIDASYRVNVTASILVDYFCEEESIWDSETKEYLCKVNKKTLLPIDADVKVHISMDRTELDMGQEPSVELEDIDLDELKDEIECDQSHYW